MLPQPNGADLSNAQWDEVVKVLKARNLPFLDIAYQGFGAGMEDDAYAIRAIASAGLPMLVSNSFSKNLLVVRRTRRRPVNRLR